QTASATLFNTKRAAEGTPWAGGDWVAFLVPEQGHDLNGDGDTDDSVLHVANVGTLQVYNLGLAVDSGLAADDSRPPVVIEGNTLAVLVSEAGQGGKDLNGDGDSEDDVLEVVDLTTRKVTRVGIAGSEVRISGNTVGALTPEKAQGNKDLNGD